MPINFRDAIKMLYACINVKKQGQDLNIAYMLNIKDASKIVNQEIFVGILRCMFLDISIM